MQFLIKSFFIPYNTMAKVHILSNNPLDEKVTFSVQLFGWVDFYNFVKIYILDRNWISYYIQCAIENTTIFILVVRFRVFPVGFFATSTPLEDRGRALAQGINVYKKGGHFQWRKANPTTRKLLETLIMVFEFWRSLQQSNWAMLQIRCCRESDFPFHM